MMSKKTASQIGKCLLVPTEEEHPATFYRREEDYNEKRVEAKKNLKIGQQRDFFSPYAIRWVIFFSTEAVLDLPDDGDLPSLNNVSWAKIN